MIAKDIDLLEKCFLSCLTGAVYGDPHFLTFDRWTYSFTGYGEFYLVKSTKPVGKEFSFQGRAAKMSYLKAGMRATSWRAFALKQNGVDQVHVEMNSNGTGN